MVKVSIQHSLRLFNFDSKVEKIVLDKGLEIIKSNPLDQELKDMDPSVHMWPSFIIQKTYKIKYKIPEYAILNKDYIDKSMKSFVGVLFYLRLLKNSAVFYDNKINFQAFEEGRKKFNFSVIKILVSSTNLGNPLLTNKSEILELKKIYRDIDNLKNQDAEKFFLALHRLCFGMERVLPRDKIIDYITGLEALYTESDELKFRLSVILASIFGNSLEEREGIFQSISDYYDLRSCIIHGSYNKKCLKIREKYLNDKAMQELEDYLRKSLKLFIRKPENFMRENLLKRILK